MPQRVISYQRYSSDNQSDASIEDQRRLCMAWIEREGAQLVGEYSDHAYSGATLLRPGYQALMADVVSGKADIVLAESLDRISRDPEHLARFIKQCEFAHVVVITLSDGVINPLLAGLRGIIGSMQLRDTADKTRRGMEGRILKGRCNGAPPYGIRMVHRLASDGEPDRGLREIHPDQAKIVQRIFRDFNSGKSALRIARELNDQGVPGPSGRAWHQASIRGRPTRQDGILRNPTYIGALVWKRRRNVRDPVTTKTVRQFNSEEILVRGEAPHLRIIDDALWNTAQARLAAEALPPTDPKITSRKTNGFWAHRRVLLLTGKIFCGACGGPFGARGGKYLGCTAAAHKACTNTRTYPRGKLEAHVLDTFANRFMQPEALAGFIEAFEMELNLRIKETAGAQESLRRDLANVERQLGNLMARIVEGLDGATVQKTLQDLEAKRDQLLAQLAKSSEQVPELNVDLARTYRDHVAKLHCAVHDKTNPELLEAARLMIERVTVSPSDDKNDPPELEIVGALPAMLVAAGAKIPLRAANDERDQSITSISLKAASGGAAPCRVRAEPGLAGLCTIDPPWTPGRLVCPRRFR